MKPVQFSQPASDELVAAIRWYDERRTALGAELYEAVVRTIDLIRNHPDTGSPRTDRS